MSDKYLQHASGFYLTDQLPDNWEDLNDEGFIDFIEQHLWQPFEYWHPADVVSEISALADSFQRIEDDLTKDK